MRGNRFRDARALALALVALWLGGCSYTIQGKRSELPVSETPECDSSAPGRGVLDASGGVIFGGIGLAALGVAPFVGTEDCVEGQMCYGNRTSFLLMGAIHVGISWLFFRAFFKGRARTRACRAAKSTHQLWLKTYSED